MQTSAVSSILQTTPASPAPKTVEEAARQFESLLIAQMLKSARESGWQSEDSEDGGSETSTMLDLSEQQFAQILAQKGGLNLSRLIVDGLKPRKTASNPQQ